MPDVGRAVADTPVVLVVVELDDVPLREAADVAGARHRRVADRDEVLRLERADIVLRGQRTPEPLLQDGARHLVQIRPVGHHRLRVGGRPVLADDEPRLDAARLELLEDVLDAALVDAHARAEGPGAHPVLDGRLGAAERVAVKGLKAGRDLRMARRRRGRRRRVNRQRAARARQFVHVQDRVDLALNQARKLGLVLAAANRPREEDVVLEARLQAFLQRPRDVRGDGARIRLGLAARLVREAGGDHRLAHGARVRRAQRAHHRGNVLRAQGLADVGARAEDGVEGVFAEDAVPL